jgi:hypothetical protein
MKIIILTEDNCPRIISIDESELHNSLILGETTYTNHGDTLHQKDWSHAYLIFYNELDTTENVRTFNDLIGDKKRPITGTVLFVKTRYTRVCDCEADDLYKINATIGSNKSYCQMM